MELFKISDIDELNSDVEKRAAALGFFDGVHKGHQKIIQQVVDFSSKENIIPILITFDKSPKDYFLNNTSKLLTPIEEKQIILDNYGIKELYVIEFNEQLSKTSKEDFIDKVLKKLNISKVFCGKDYRFGSGGEGNPEFIKLYSNNSIDIEVEDILYIGNQKISSTYLKEEIIKGNVEKYRQLTDRNYKFSGFVVKGRQLGRTINFPTANLNITENYIVPKKYGVYLTKINVKGIYYKGITNIGNNPTVSNNEEKLFIETHIIDFDMDIYDEYIEIEFYRFIRGEKKFSGIEELKTQLLKDKELAEKIDF